MRDIMGMMSKAKELQSKMQAMQDEIATLEVEGSAGAGLVTVTMTAKGDLRKIAIDPSLLIRRMGANASAQARVQQELVNARKALLKEQRRVEHLEKRLLTVRSEDERKEFSMQIEEFISRATTLKTK